MALWRPERKPVGITEGRQDLPEEDGVSMLSQCHAQEPWV
jgi:hypothetical protein